MNNILGYVRNKFTAWKDSIKALDCETLAVENGCEFTTSAIVTISAQTSLYVCGLTGLSNTKTIWMTLPTFKGNQPDVEIYAYKGTNFTGGTPVSKYNHNHQNPKTSVWQSIVLNPTINDIGEKFYEDYIPGVSGVPANTSGGESSSEEKYKFDFNENYCLQIVNNETSNCKCLFKIKWFEVEGSIV